MLYFAKAILITVTAVLFSSCQFTFDFDNGIDGNGNVTTETRKWKGDFTKIDACCGLEVQVEQSDNVSIEVVADENLLKHIITKIENGTLYISTDENIDEAESKTVKVKLPVIKSVATSSGASLYGKNTLLGSYLKVKTGSGSEIDLKIEMDAVDCEASSGSEITIKGKALQLNTASSSGSEIDASELLTNKVTSKSSSGSATDVYPILHLEAKASSGSSINYHNTPKNIVKTESSGGSVSKE
jgi:hypothetical protein